MSKDNLGEAEKLKAEIKAFQDSIDTHAIELKTKQDAKKQLVDDLNLIRCQDICKQITGIIKDFLKLEKPFGDLKIKILEIQKSDPNWLQIIQKSSEDRVFNEIADACFRGDRVKSLTLQELISKAKVFSGNKSKPVFKFND